MDRFEPCLDGSITRRIMGWSQEHWELLAALAQSSSHIGVSSTDLQALLCRVPAFPDNVSRAQRFISGFSRWANPTSTCYLQLARGKDRNILLRHSHPTICRISKSTSFQKWEGYSNNGIALIIIGWAYIFGVNLAERQGMSVKYAVQAANTQNTDQDPDGLLDFGYATPEERTWWKAITSRGRGWIVEGRDAVMPWSLTIEDLGVDVLDGKVDETDQPPSSTQAASYLGRFCAAYGLGSQLTAALAAAICLPLQDVIMSDWTPQMDIPKPSLSQPRATLDGEPCLPPEFKLMDYYMTLSLDTRTVGSTLWSVFWSDGVACNSVGAWFGPISAVLSPFLDANDHEGVAKILSLASPKVSPLWIGSALLGPNSLLKSIQPYLERHSPIPSTGPDPTSAAWTGIPHSFLDNYTMRPCTEGTVSRTDVWRLRIEADMLYLDRRHGGTGLPHSWPPFGRMPETDVEPELRYHLGCTHHWEYLFWEWPTSKDEGFTSNGTLQSAFSVLRDPSLEGGDSHPVPPGTSEARNRGMNHMNASNSASSRLIAWAEKNIENGFNLTSVIILDYDGQAEATSSVNALQAEMENITTWVSQEDGPFKFEMTDAAASEFGLADAAPSNFGRADAIPPEFELADTFMSDDSADFEDFLTSDESAESDGAQEESPEDEEM